MRHDGIISRMSGFIIIEQDDRLARACAELSATGMVALDTEFIRVETYFPVLCLVQMQGTGGPYLVDPLAIKNLGPLHALISNAEVEIILHSCRQDLEALDTRMDVAIGSLFDTQVAAAFCGFGDQISYAAMVETVTGISLSKAYTRADWGQRPLPKDELLYAADDVRFLPQLRDCLGERLQRNGRMSWFREECQRQIAPTVWRPDPEQAWRRLKGGSSLPVHAQETARQLAVWREQQAVRSNRPREWILPTRELLAISHAGSGSMCELHRVKGVSRKTLRRYGKAIERICREAPRECPARVLWARGILTAEDRVRVKGIMNLLQTVAADLGISPSLLANRSSVEEFVRSASETELFRGWRWEVVGARVLAEFS